MTPVLIDIPKPLPPHPWHPSVIYDGQYFGGHRFWMAETPFPPFQIKPYKDRWELPCIHYSDDGIHWKSIQTNPIDDLTAEQITAHSYHSDPHLVLKDGVLYCYYRLMEDNDASTTIIRRSSKDGEIWSDREIVKVVGGEDDSVNREIISPAIVWTGKSWLLYYVDDTFTNLNRGIQIAESKDGITFYNKGSVWVHQDVFPWHIDVQLMNGLYKLLIYDVDRNQLVMYRSESGLQFVEEQFVLRASGKLSDFWSHKLYRSCLVNVEGREQIYFSSHDGMASYVALMRQSDDGIFSIVDCLRGRERIFFELHFIGNRLIQFVLRGFHFVRKRFLL